MFVRTLGLRVVVVTATVVATRLCDVQLASHQLATTVFTVLSLALDSLAIATVIALTRAAPAANRANISSMVSTHWCISVTPAAIMSASER